MIDKSMINWSSLAGDIEASLTVYFTFERLRTKVFILTEIHDNFVGFKTLLKLQLKNSFF